MNDTVRLVGVGAAWAAIVMVPGPDFVATAQYAAVRSRRAAFGAVAGIAVGTAIWATSALLGLSVLLAHARWSIDLVRIGGSCFLAFLGVRAIVRARRPSSEVAEVSFRSVPWLTGFLTDLANPKAALFWTTLFAALLPVHAGAAWTRWP